MLLTKELDPPSLEGNFSPAFKDFVSKCLRKNPDERLSAGELLVLPFISNAAHPSTLCDLISRYQKWKGLTKRRKSVRERLLDRRLLASFLFFSSPFRLMSLFISPCRSILQHVDVWDFQDDNSNSEQSRTEEQLLSDQELEAFLKEFELSSVFELLKNHDIDVETFALLRQEDLEKMSMSIGHQKKVMLVITRLKEEEEAQKPKPRRTKGLSLFCPRTISFFLFLFF